MAHAQVLDRAQRGAGRPPDVVDTALQPVELLDDRQRDHDVAPSKVARSRGRRSGPRCRRRSGSAPRSTLTSLPILGRRRREPDNGQEIGQRHSSSDREGMLAMRDRSDWVPNGCLLYRTTPGRAWMARSVHTPVTDAATLAPWSPTARSAPSSPGCGPGRGRAPRRGRRRLPGSHAAVPRPRLVVPTAHIVTLPVLVDVGPFFERVQRVAAVMPGRAGRAGNVRRQQQRRQPERRPPPRARRAAHEGRRVARLLLAPSQVRRRRGGGGRGDVARGARPGVLTETCSGGARWAGSAIGTRACAVDGRSALSGKRIGEVGCICNDLDACDSDPDGDHIGAADARQVPSRDPRNDAGDDAGRIKEDT